jgi:hypothetical protein
MAQYGSEANNAGALLRQLIETRLEQGWALETSGGQATRRPDQGPFIKSTR